MAYSGYGAGRGYSYSGYGGSGSSSAPSAAAPPNVLQTVLSVLGRPNQAVMQGLHAFSGQGLNALNPSVIAQGAEGFAHGLTDVSGKGDINVYQMENKQAPQGRLGQVSSVLFGLGLDPTMALGAGEARGAAALAQTGIKAIRDAHGAELAGKVSDVGYSALNDAEKAQVQGALHTSDAAKNYAGGPDKFVSDLIGGGATKTGFGAERGAIGEAQAGIRALGHTLVPAKTIKAGAEASGVAPALRAAASTKTARAVGNALSTRAGVTHAFGRAVGEDVRQAQVEADQIRNQVLGSAGQNLEKAEQGVSPQALQRISSVLNTQSTHLARGSQLPGVALTDASRLHDAFVAEGDVKSADLLQKLEAQLRTNLNLRSGKASTVFKPGEVLAEENPVNAVIKDTQDTARQLAKEHVISRLQGIKTDEGKALLNKLTSGKELPEGFTRIPTPQGDFVAPNEVSDYLKRLNETYSSPESMRQLGKIIQGADKVWRQGATSALFAAGLPFQIHNTVGNVINMFLNGFRDPRYFSEANKLRDVVVKAEKGGQSLSDSIKASDLSEMEKERIQSAIDKGLLHESYFRTDLSGIGGKVGNVITKVTGANVGRRVAQYLEDNSRLAMFLHGMDSTGSAASAERLVKESLFNYGDLTAAERQLKKWVPFYTWQKNNTPFQLKMLAAVPGQQHAVENMMTALEQSPNAQQGWQDDMPPWAKQGNMALLGEVEGTPFYGAFPTPLRSLTDTLGIGAALGAGQPTNAAQQAASNLGGLQGSALKEVVAYASGYDPFTGKALPQGSLAPAEYTAQQLYPGASRTLSAIKGAKGNAAQQRAKLVNQLLGLSTTVGTGG